MSVSYKRKLRNKGFAWTFLSMCLTIDMLYAKS